MNARKRRAAMMMMMGGKARTPNDITGFAHVYYVRKTGNDMTGDGTTAKPYLTLTKAMTVGGAGDAIVVGDGTYAEGAAGSYWTISKNLADWMTIMPEYVDGDVTVTGNGNATYNVYFAFGTHSHLRFKNLKFGMSAGSTQAVRVTGTVSYCEFIGCTINPVSGATDGLYLSPTVASNVSVTNCTINAPATSGYTAVNVSTNSNWTAIAFDTCQINGSSQWSSTSRGVWAHGTNALGGSVAFTNCTFSTGGLGTALDTGGTFTFTGCTFNTGEVLIGADGSGDQASAVVTASFTNCTINKVGAVGHALIFGNGCTGCLADNVTITGSVDDGLVLKQHTGTEVRNCHITGGSVAAVYLKAAIGANVHDNVVTAATGYGFQMLKGDTGNKCQNWTFRDNTINAPSSGKALNIGGDVDDAGGGVCDYNSYKNNSGLGLVRGDADVQNLSELQAAWVGYGDGSNDSHSTVV